MKQISKVSVIVFLATFLCCAFLYADRYYYPFCFSADDANGYMVIKNFQRKQDVSHSHMAICKLVQLFLVVQLKPKSKRGELPYVEIYERLLTIDRLNQIQEYRLNDKYNQKAKTTTLYRNYLSASHRVLERKTVTNLSFNQAVAIAQEKDLFSLKDSGQVLEITSMCGEQQEIDYFIIQELFNVATMERRSYFQFNSHQEYSKPTLPGVPKGKSTVRFSPYSNQRLLTQQTLNLNGSQSPGNISKQQPYTVYQQLPALTYYPWTPEVPGYNIPPWLYTQYQYGMPGVTQNQINYIQE